MPSAKIGTENVTSFDFGDGYQFTACFDDKQPLNQLEVCSKRDDYRVRTPGEDLEEVQQIVSTCSDELVIGESSEDYCAITDEEADSIVVKRNSVSRRRGTNPDCRLLKIVMSRKQSIVQGGNQVKIGIRHEEYRMRNRQIIAGPTVNTPVGTGRYKYFPNGHVSKRTSE